MSTITMEVPAGFVSGVIGPSGVTYTANAAGQIAAQAQDVFDLIGANFIPVGAVLNSIPNPRNLVDGGNFSTNPFQRNIPGLASGGVISSAISNTVTYFADRWFAVGGASSAILMAAVADTAIAGFAQSLKMSRQAANANTAALYLGHVLETLRSLAAQGQQITLSFYAKQGANYSGGQLSVSLVAGLGTNQSAASLVAGSWTSQSSVISATQTLTTTETRYSFSGNVPAGATQLGILLSWTPSGTAGSDDSVTIQGVQLEIGGMTPFEFRSMAQELDLCQRFAWTIAEPASGVVIAPGMISATNAQEIVIPCPEPMFKAPTVTVSAGSLKFNIAGTATAVGAGFAAASTHTPSAVTLVGTVTATAGQATVLQGGGGSGYILASSDF